ncbi:SLAM family member 8-like isoform X2 [Rhinatrema bivittatum]|uniref:SLAM family member 8-like isoform X2 n=1 Tax=Rhinatrema bivittatum TaxID=194408 RepID=UPI00112D806A|nr:SLAM family member 8-like isoform X2 [Rhinatrema bivittatum]
MGLADLLWLPGAVLLLLSDVVIVQAENPPPRWVNGIRGESVLLPPDEIPGRRIQEIEWFFGSGLRVSIGKSKDGMLEEYNYTNRFHQRLKMQNETALRIDGLEMGDTGTFQALVRFTTGTVVSQDFHLTVYEPVPTPEIRILSSSNDICNVTLGCVVPAEAAVNVTWKAPTHLEGPDQYQLSPDRTILHLSLNLSALDRVFFCEASNPVQMKSISINASSLCAGRGSASISQVMESSPGVEYAVIKRTPPEGNDEVLANPETSPMGLKHPPQKLKTIYDEVRFSPRERPAEVI